MLILMGVDEDELDPLFKTLDANHNGRLDTQEFIRSFYEMRTHVQQTTLYFIMKYVESNTQMLADVQEMVSQFTCSRQASVNDDREPLDEGSVLKKGTHEAQ